MRLLHLCVALALASSTSPVWAAANDFDVDFVDCVEYVGIGFVPAARARPLVPAAYTLAGDDTNAVAVVRVTKCASVAIDGKNAKPARTAQIGVMLDVPDSTADIDNYLLWYATDLGTLHGKLSAAGVDSSVDAQLSFEFSASGPSGPLSIDVAPPRQPAYELLGTATVPTTQSVQFVANWFSSGAQGTLLMHTVLPSIRFSGANVTMTFAPSSALGALTGGQSLTFALLDSYNAFDSAHMEATMH